MVMTSALSRLMRLMLQEATQFKGVQSSKRNARKDIFYQERAQKNKQRKNNKKQKL